MPDELGKVDDQQNTASIEKKPSNLEEASMRKIAFYVVIGFCIISEATSFVAFFLTKNIEACMFQIPTILCFYRILCFLFPSNEANVHPFVAIVQAIWRH